MHTRKEIVSVNNLLKQTGTIYRMILQLPFTLYQLHHLCLQPVNTEGLVPKRRAKYKHAAKAKPTLLLKQYLVAPGDSNY